MMARTERRQTFPSVILAAFLLVGCSGGNGATRRAAPSLGHMGTSATEPGVEVELLDLNGDHQPDVWRYFRVVDSMEAPRMPSHEEIALGTWQREDAGDEAAPWRVLFRKEVDLNFDGSQDVRVLIDDAGRVSREEFDLDFDGRVDMVSDYQGGALISQAMDQGFDGTIDVWRYFEEGRIVRKERDTDGDGLVDVWEYFDEGRLVRIGRDVNRDEKPDNFEAVEP